MANGMLKGNGVLSRLVFHGKQGDFVSNSSIMVELKHETGLKPILSKILPYIYT